MLALLYLLLALVVGVLLLRRILPADLGADWALVGAGGVVLATLLTSWVPFALAYLVGFNGLDMALALVATALAAAWLAWPAWQGRDRERRLGVALAAWLAPPANRALAATCAVVGGIFAYLLHTHVLQDMGGGDL